MPERLALYLQDTDTLRDAIRMAQYAETRGFEAVWQAETTLARDALVALAAYAATTLRIRIASGVVNNWTRNPAALAAAFATLDDLAPDRVICGLGTWHDPLASQVGINRHKPLLAMRETVTALRALLAGQRVTLNGEFVRLDRVMLDSARPRTDRHIPIYIGATGPKMAALAGEIADGVLLNYLVSPAYNAEVMDELARGLRQSGRHIDSLDRPQLILCSVSRDRKAALDTARRVVTQYIAQQPGVMRASGVPQGLIDEIAQVLPDPTHEESLTDASYLVPDDVVQLVTASGDAGEVRRKVTEYLAAGATCPVLYALGNDTRYMIDVFADPYTS